MAVETTEITQGSAVKITCPKDDLSQALQLVGRSVSTRTSVQILAGILLRAEDGVLALAATDMEMSLRVSVPATVEEDGAVVVPGRLLSTSCDSSLPAM